MADPYAPLRKVVAEMGAFAHQGAEETFPASAISLTAVRETKPALAKLIFSESVIAPARELLIKYGCADEAFQKLEELESRFLQEPVVSVLYDVELLLASRLISRLWDINCADYERMCLEPTRNDRGDLIGGFQLLHWLSDDIAAMFGELANVRERRVQLLLAGAAAGPKALEKALSQSGEYHKGAILQSVYDWLLLNGIDDKERRTRLTDAIAEHTDEKIYRFLNRLVGCTSMTDEYVRTLVDEIFTGEREIKF